MHGTYYSALERGESNLTFRTLRRVSVGLGAKMWEVLRDADL
jgi:transcriptional regulator with XRE-family HTH domain